MLIRFLLAALLLLALGGCTVYKVRNERTLDGTVTTQIDVYSSRNIVAPHMSYARKGADANFNFNAESTTQPGPQDYAAGVVAGVKAVLGKGGN